MTTTISMCNNSQHITTAKTNTRKAACACGITMKKGTSLVFFWKRGSGSRYICRTCASAKVSRNLFGFRKLNKNYDHFVEAVAGQHTAEEIAAIIAAK